MALSCNIDRKGKLVRLVYGVALVLAGIGLMIGWAMGTGLFWRWAISSACLAGGALAIFEARAGWCVVRAMGIKTPL
jgi:hypothetical protein